MVPQDGFGAWKIGDGEGGIRTRPLYRNKGVLRRILAFYGTEKKGSEQLNLVPPYCPKDSLLTRDPWRCTRRKNAASQLELSAPVLEASASSSIDRTLRWYRNCQEMLPALFGYIRSRCLATCATPDATLKSLTAALPIPIAAAFVLEREDTVAAICRLTSAVEFAMLGMVSLVGLETVLAASGNGLMQSLIPQDRTPRPLKGRRGRNCTSRISTTPSQFRLHGCQSELDGGTFACFNSTHAVVLPKGTT